MSNLRNTLKALRTSTHRANLVREIKLRDIVIETLCYRHEIRNPTDGGDWRVRIFVKKHLDMARRGTIQRFTVPPSVRLLHALERAYYNLPVRISMCHMNDNPLPDQVHEDAAKVAESEFHRLMGNRDELLLAVQAYLFTEQSQAGRNPHRSGTNKRRAFELAQTAMSNARQLGEVPPLFKKA